MGPFSLKNNVVRWVSLVSAALALMTSVRAGIVSTVTGTVAYTPPSFVFEGALSTTTPLTESYPLVIASPGTLITGTAVPVTLKATCTAAPAGVSTATALGFLTFSTTSLNFTGPNQSMQAIVTLTIPPGTFAGNYAWTINITGWPLSLGTIIDGIGGLGTTINANISPAGTAPQAPVITLTGPSAGQVFTVAAGSTTAAVPYAATGSTPVGSLFTAVTSASLTLTQGGTAVAGFAPVFTLVGVGGANTGITTSGSVNLPGGTYTFSATATNNSGVSAVATPITFTVVGAPTLTITAPTAGQVFTAAAGATTAAVPYAISGATSAGSTFPTNASASATLTLGGTVVAAFAPVFSGAGTAAIAATGTANLAPGTYTLTSTATNSAGLTVTATAVTFTVNAAPAAPTETLIWLQNNNCGYGYGGGQASNANVTQQSAAGGTVVPLVFGLYTGSTPNNNGCGNRGSSNQLTFVSDPSTEIAIYEVFSNNTSSPPLIYTYSANGPNPPFFSIGSSEYLLNFPTAGGRHHYVAEIYHAGAGGVLQLLGSDDLYTTQNCLPQDSAVQGSFNGTAIAAGNTVWFSSIVNLSSYGAHAATLLFDNSTITFTVKGVAVTLTVPAASIKFDSAATAASTVYNASTQSWVTIVPAGYSGNVFLTGLAYVVPAGVPANLSGVTWTGDFRSDSSAIAANWQWSAAVYTKFGSTLSALAIKPVAASNLSLYANSDPAGTPENFKSFVIAGARGAGGGDVVGSESNLGYANIGSDNWQSSGCSGDQVGDHCGDSGSGGCR
jgi:hypothetical protein